MASPQQNLYTNLIRYQHIVYGLAQKHKGPETRGQR